MTTSLPDNFDKAEKKRARAEYTEALDLYKKALRAYSKSRDTDGMLQCLLSIGDTYRMTGGFLNSVSAYAEAITLSRQLKNRQLQADAITGLGLSKRALGDWKEALNLFSRAKKIYEKQADTTGIAFLLWAEGGAFRIKGDIKNAIKSLKQAKKAFEALGSEDDRMSGSGYCMCGLGGVSRVAGRFDDSMKYYTAANSIMASMSDRFGTAYSHCGIGNAYRMKGDFVNALKHLKKAESIYRQIGDIVSYSYTLWSIGMVNLITGKLKKAEEYFGKAGTQFRKTKDIRGLIYNRLGIGQLLFMKGGQSKAKAKEQIKKAVEASVNNNFAIEACYSKSLSAFMNNKSASAEGFKKLGLRHSFSVMPFNIP